METRSRILRAARDIYLAEQLPGFSMRKVAARVGVTATALYRHFGGKEELIASVVDEGFRIFGSGLMEALKGKTPRARLEQTGLAYRRFGLDHPEYYRLIFMSAAQDHGLARVAEANPQKLSASFLFLVDRVRDASKTGLLPAADPLELSASLWSFWHGMVSLHLLGSYRPVLNTRADFEAFFKRASRRFIEGLAP